MAKIAKATKEAPSATGARTRHPGTAVVDKMLEAGRAGRLRGAGFYDYDESGTRGSLWPGLAELFPVAQQQLAAPGRQGPDAVRRGARDRQVLRGGRDRVLRGRQHRLDHGHRLPAQDRRRRPVHDRLRGPGTRTADRPGAFLARADSSRRRTATGSRPPPYLRDLAAGAGHSRPDRNSSPDALAATSASPAELRPGSRRNAASPAEFAQDSVVSYEGWRYEADSNQGSFRS